MNLGELKTFVYETISQDGSRSSLVDSELTRILNEGQAKMASTIAEIFEGFFSATSLISEVADQSTYDLPTNCLRVVSIERLVGGGLPGQLPYFLRRITQNQWEIDESRHVSPIAINQRLYGDVYYQVGLKQFVIVSGSPETLTDSLRLTYIFRSAPMAAAGDTPFQSAAGIAGAGDDQLVEWHDIIGLYGAERALLKEENFEQHDRVKALRLEREQELKQYLDRVNVQEPRHVNYTDDEDWIGS